MKKLMDLFDTLNKKYFSSDKQLTRIVILTGIVLVLAVGSFAGYYWYDRYYRPQPKSVEITLSQAEKAVQDNPQDVKARITLAEAYMQNRRWNDAITQANQVLTVQPDNQHAWLVLGVSYANLNQPNNAIDPLKRFVDARKDEDMAGLDSQLQAAAYYLGDSYLQIGQPQDAVTPLELDVQWSKSDADAMYKLGMAYAGTKQYEKAVGMFQEASTFVPDFKEAYQAMAAAYQNLGKPEMVDYANGMVAFSTKDYVNALTLLQKAAQQRSDFAPIFAGLGRVYEAQNDLQNAKSAYQTALKIDSNNFTAVNGLERVNNLLNK